MSKHTKLSRRISAFMLVFALLSLLMFATMVYADEAETSSQETGTSEPAETTPTFISEENKEGGSFWSIFPNFFGKILAFCNNVLTHNYILALFLFSLIMQLALCWVGIKQQKNSVGQARLAPKVAAINKKYAGRNDQVTLQKKQQETMELYQKEGFNPMGGCLPLLIQMPIILILYNVVISPIQYIMGLSSSVASNLKYMLMSFDPAFTSGTRAQEMNVITWFRDNGTEGLQRLREWVTTTVLPVNSEAATNYNGALDAIAGKMDSLPDFTIGPLDLAQTPSFSGNGSDLGKWLLLLVPVLTLVFLILTQKLTRKFTYQSPEAQQAQSGLSMKIMTWSMPLLSCYFTFIVPAVIGVYWIFRNILNLIQQIILAKVMPVPKFTEEDYKAAERELLGSSSRKKERLAKNTDPNRPKVRSLHHIDDEGYDNGYKIDPNAPTFEEPVGSTTDTLEAPAPIKNDEKTSYTVKSSEEK